MIINRLLPLPLRIFLKERLSKRAITLEGGSATTLPSPEKRYAPAANPKKHLKSNTECRLCGTAVRPVYDRDQPTWIRDAVKDVDTFFAPSGKQIFLTASGKSPRAGKPQSKVCDGIEWLKQKGWLDASVFDPDEFYGKGAGEAFGCLPVGSDTEAVIVLTKRSAV